MEPKCGHYELMSPSHNHYHELGQIIRCELCVGKPYLDAIEKLRPVKVVRKKKVKSKANHIKKYFNGRS